MKNRSARLPMPEIAVRRARVVRAEVGYAHPTEMEIEVLAHIRHALVRESPTSGARANLLRLGERGVISVASGLPLDQRRWAVAHELGHFEIHGAVSYLGVCIGEDLRHSYDTSGHEQEANAFAAELLMPQDLFGPKCDVAKVSWTPIIKLAQEFQVSVTAAVLRFLAFTWDRVAVIACVDGKVAWSQSTRDFGRRLVKGTPVDQWSLAYDFFKNGEASQIPETVSAAAWVPDAPDGDEVVEHVLPMPNYGMALSLLWFPAK
jgi:Zn-dependent peptidase ImmA (M78 family)